MRRVSYHRVNGGGSTPTPPVTTSGFLQFEAETQKIATGINETVVWEDSADFGLLTTPNAIAQLAALTWQTGGATGTYRVRVGGTLGAADGTIVVELQTTHAGYVLPPDGAIGVAFPLPSGRQLIKLTSVASLLNQKARIRGFEIVFVPSN